MENIITILENLNSPDEVDALLSRLKCSLEAGSGKDGYLLAMLMEPQAEYPYANGDIIRYLKTKIDIGVKYYELAYDALLINAANGDAEAMYLISFYYQCGTPPVAVDREQFYQWTHRAFCSGHLFAANNLYSIYKNPEYSQFDLTKARELLNFLEAKRIRVVP